MRKFVCIELFDNGRVSIDIECPSIVDAVGLIEYARIHIRCETIHSWKNGVIQNDKSDITT